MDKQKQVLIQFAGIFIVCAVVIFLFMHSQQRPTLIPESGLSDEFHDSLTITLVEEIKRLKTQLTDNPDSLEILTQIGNHYFDIDQPENAITYYEKAIKIKPDNASVLTDCAVMYNQLGNSEKALDYLDRAIALEPDLAQAYFNKGVILMTAKNDPQGAVAVWKKFIEVAPESEYAELLKRQIKDIESSLR